MVKPPADGPDVEQDHARGGVCEQHEGQGEVGLAGQAGGAVKHGLPERREEQESDGADHEDRAERRARQRGGREHVHVEDRDPAVDRDGDKGDDYEPPGGPERKTAFQPRHARQEARREEKGRDREAEEGRDADRPVRGVLEAVGDDDARRQEPVDRKDAAHRREPEAHEEHAVEADLGGGHRQNRGREHREQRGRRDDVEMLRRPFRERLVGEQPQHDDGQRDDDQRPADQQRARHAGFHERPVCKARVRLQTG